MYNDLLSTIRQYHMIRRGDTVTCAVSGGADSMALLWCMYLLRDKLEIQVQAAHFNHRLRGEESDRDEAFVREFCDRFEIPLLVGSSRIEPGPKGLEAAARDARYAFLDTIPGKIATAHTADDNAETVLMHLVRGTGLKGLGGITPVRGRIIRPMLDVTREQVMAFLEEYHISFVEDSSNGTDAFLRNRLRHHVMPLLRQENPRLSQNLSAMAQRLREDEQALSVQADLSGGLPLALLRELPEAQQNRLICRFLQQYGVKEPDSDHISLVRSLARSQKPSARASLPGGVTVVRQYDRLVRLQEEPVPEPVVLTCPGSVCFGQYRILCEPAEPGSSGAVCPVGSMVVRSRESGDCIRLAGGTKSLKKIYIDRKIPADRRALLPVVTDEKGVLAVGEIGFNMDRQNGASAVRITFL